MNFTMISYWIVKNHPYQNVFFNSFSKKYAKGFELDYWGLTNLKALKNIIKNETTFPVYISHFHDRSRIDFSLHMLNKEDKKKIKLVKDWRDKKVKYIITNINNAFTDKHYDSLGLETYNIIKIDDLIINRILVKK
tara:strand:- start:254 stop:661 length:408 start_codon:yes stop_codon:yes gene_type:complete